MNAPATKQVLILGGGFGGLYAALGLERMLTRKKRDVQVTLVNGRTSPSSPRCCMRLRLAIST